MAIRWYLIRCYRIVVTVVLCHLFAIHHRAIASLVPIPSFLVDRRHDLAENTIITLGGWYDVAAPTVSPRPYAMSSVPKGLSPRLFGRLPLCPGVLFASPKITIFGNLPDHDFNVLRRSFNG